MGLSAAQARLLTITSRKSDCEFQSMRYSHEKIALSREMTDISNEYQNALNQTKLIYDFYGNGTGDMLSYGLMMTPSEINGYMPILSTDASGKVILSDALAQAAMAAGIPREGLGCLPSSTMRNDFYKGMGLAGVITESTATTLQGVQYSQDIGMGNAGALVTTKTEEMTLSELIDYYKESGSSPVISYDEDTLRSRLGKTTGGRQTIELVKLRNGPESDNLKNKNYSIIEILEGQYQLLIQHQGAWANGDDDGRIMKQTAGNVQNLPIWDELFSGLESMLQVPGDVATTNALDYAEAMCRNLLNMDGKTTDNSARSFKAKAGRYEEHNDIMIRCMNEKEYSPGGHGGGNLWGTNLGYNTSDYIGITTVDNTAWQWFGHAIRDGVSVDISNIAKAFLTYFAQAIEGVNNSEYRVSDNAGNRTVADSKLINDGFKFNIVTEEGLNSNQVLNSGFYDALFNQICTRGWVQNNNITDKGYLQQMLQNGMIFIATCQDDGMYAQGLYSTNTFIKEITDDEAIAKAEAKYNTEKQKINHKEEIIDLKMKNLDTEISSLTTEYESIKSVLKSNIDRSFTRYEA